jgi:hypothetical protein
VFAISMTLVNAAAESHPWTDGADSRSPRSTYAQSATFQSKVIRSTCCRLPPPPVLHSSISVAGPALSFTSLNAVSCWGR